jgi:hypothetical protein
MRDLILQELNNLAEALKKEVPQTKKITESKSIIEVKPIELLDFMKDNDIPDNAEFAFDEEDVYLCWDVEVPMTSADKIEWLKEMFEAYAFTYVRKVLTKNGYKRVGVYSSQFVKFDDQTPFDLYAKGEFDRLVDFYTMYFAPIS